MTKSKIVENYYKEKQSPKSGLNKHFSGISYLILQLLKVAFVC